MQDNVLWKRHALTLAQQVALAVYDVARTPWPDRRLLAAVVLMFLSGCVKYAERTLCLARASPARLTADFLGCFQDRISSIKEMQAIARDGGLGSSRYLNSRAFTRFSLNPAMDVMSTDILPNYDWSASRDIFSDLYSKIRRLGRSDQEEYFRRTYRFAEERLFVCYRRLYTKALFRLSPLGAFLHLVTFLSTSSATALFHLSVSGGQAGRTYSSTDVAVTYVLLAGAVTLEVSSCLLSMLTRQDLWSHPVLCCSCLQQLPIIKLVFCLTCGNCAVLLRRWRRPRHWSQELAQYSVVGRSAQKAYGGRLLPGCVAKHVTEATRPVPVTDGLKLFVIERLLDADAMPTGSDFTGSRGELALSKWMGSLEAPAAASGILHESLRDVDFPTSVLLWHIATEVCFFNAADAGAAAATALPANPADEERKKIGRQLSNYVMYLVFKCGVLRNSGSEFLLRKAKYEIHERIKGQRQHGGDGKEDRSREEVAVERIVKSGDMGQVEPRGKDIVAAAARNDDDAAATAASAIEVLSDRVLPRALKVAAALDGVRGGRPQQGYRAASRWDLIAAVWLEMLYYIGPRCGAAFHREHLSNGGEFATHVLVLMYIIGPLGYHPDMLSFEPLNK
ncbi:uncharacterized protein LOC120686809 isoform X2 [Panicum virgatum]|nr:uncharacterized protein LOC120686809 isoform X2 [Panicum virgatum]KAG2557605.1 hypothetical protein PVAP13_8NG220206 [Panicum virgatum]